eukprot:1520298-Rhodomonas_salina.1
MESTKRLEWYGKRGQANSQQSSHGSWVEGHVLANANWAVRARNPGLCSCSSGHVLTISVCRKSRPTSHTTCKPNQFRVVNLWQARALLHSHAQLKISICTLCMQSDAPKPLCASFCPIQNLRSLRIKIFEAVGIEEGGRV